MADIFELFRKIAADGTSAQTPASLSHLVVGLGNPGASYRLTRHNTGFMALDYIAEKAGVSVDRARFKALTGEATIAGRRVLLVKPQTYMNASGEAVREAADFYKIPPERIIVLFDDISLEPGRLRVRRDGSAGGHNGLKSIIAQLGSDAFPRIKIGVGAKPHPDYDLADWVLSEFPAAERPRLFEALGLAYEGLCLLLSGDTEGAMQLCNAKRP